MKHTLLQSQFSLIWVFFPAATYFTFVYNRNKEKKKNPQINIWKNPLGLWKNFFEIIYCLMH